MDVSNQQYSCFNIFDACRFAWIWVLLGFLVPVQLVNATDNADLEYSYTAGTHRLNEVIDWYNQEIYEFTYDGNGNVNRLSSVLGSSDYQITSTSYDWRNLPLSMVVSGAGTHTWRYDHQGQRVYSSSGSTYWLRGAMGETVALYGFDGSGIELVHWNLLDAGGAVIGRREGSTRYYYHTDHLGSTRAVVDASGTVSEVYDYMPFGELMDGRSTTGDLTREKFTAQPWDPEVNLYTMHWRRYVPWFGVFTSVVPMAVDYPAWSPYAYVLNDPVRYIDPDGQAPCCWIPLGLTENMDNLSAALGDEEAMERSMMRWGVRLTALTLIVPGPEDVVLGAFMASKAARGVLKYTDDAIGLAKEYFKRSDEVVDVARTGTQGVNRIYSARELERRAAEPGSFHNFPESFNKVIFQNGTKTITPNYFNVAKPGLSNTNILYRYPGTINGTKGFYEIGVRPSLSGNTEVIMHRFFNPIR